jgi:hypothetical protein
MYCSQKNKPTWSFKTDILNMSSPSSLCDWMLGYNESLAIKKKKAASPTSQEIVFVYTFQDLSCS